MPARIQHNEFDTNGDVMCQCHVGINVRTLRYSKNKFLLRQEFLIFEQY